MGSKGSGDFSASQTVKALRPFHETIPAEIRNLIRHLDGRDKKEVARVIVSQFIVLAGSQMPVEEAHKIWAEFRDLSAKLMGLGLAGVYAHTDDNVLLAEVVERCSKNLCERQPEVKKTIITAFREIQWKDTFIFLGNEWLSGIRPNGSKCFTCLTGEQTGVVFDHLCDGSELVKKIVRKD